MSWGTPRSALRARFSTDPLGALETAVRERDDALEALRIMEAQRDTLRERCERLLSAGARALERAEVAEPFCQTCQEAEMILGQVVGLDGSYRPPSRPVRPREGTVAPDPGSGGPAS